MRLYVIRHVTAGERSKWPGSDDLRPVSKTGRRQAIAIADRLETENVAALISSPALRCVQTLEPLADRLAAKVEVDDRLAEGSALEDVLALVGEAPDGSVLCSHGDVVPELISALVRRGTELTGEPDWRKAALWVLDDGKAAVEPPPAV